MKTAWLFVALCALFLAGTAGRAPAQYSYSIAQISDPQNANDTQVYGISGNELVGQYGESTDAQGFIYDGHTFTTLDYPGALDTIARGVDGNSVVGSYQTSASSPFSSFLYNGTSFTNISDPQATLSTYATGISGDNIVGFYLNGSGARGFLYNGTSYSTLNDPLAVNGTFVGGIDGNLITGSYLDANNISHGFIYDGTTYRTIDDPLADTSPGTMGGTSLVAISGNIIVGSYLQTNAGYVGFIYDGNTFETINGTQFIAGVDGNKLVGYNYAAATTGFEVTLATPEPSAWILGLLGIGFFIGLRLRPNRLAEKN